MSGRYFQVTYRDGKPLAAYLYLPRLPGDVSVRVEAHGPGYLVDHAADGRSIGVEMPSPSLVTLAGLNAVLETLGVDAASEAELSPVATT